MASLIRSLKSPSNLRSFIVNQFHSAASSTKPTPADVTEVEWPTAADLEMKNPRLQQHMQSAIRANHYLRHLEAQNAQRRLLRYGESLQATDAKYSQRRLNEALIRGHFP